MVPNPQYPILYLVDNGLGWKGANIKTLWLHFSHFVCHTFSKDVNSFLQSMVLHWITLFVPIQRSRIATLYENLKKKKKRKSSNNSRNICPKLLGSHTVGLGYKKEILDFILSCPSEFSGVLINVWDYLKTFIGPPNVVRLIRNFQNFKLWSNHIVKKWFSTQKWKLTNVPTCSNVWD